MVCNFWALLTIFLGLYDKFRFDLHFVKIGKCFNGWFYIFKFFTCEMLILIDMYGVIQIQLTTCYCPIKTEQRLGFFWSFWVDSLTHRHRKWAWPKFFFFRFSFHSTSFHCIQVFCLRFKINCGDKINLFPWSLWKIVPCFHSLLKMNNLSMKFHLHLGLTMINILL